MKITRKIDEKDLPYEPDVVENDLYTVFPARMAT